MKYLFLLLSVLLLFYSCKTVPEVAFEKTQEKAVDKNPIQSDLIPLFNDLFNTYSIKVKIITTNEVCLRSDFVLNTIDFISGKQVSSFRDKMITILSKDKLCYYNDMVFTSPLVIKTDDFFPLYINNQMYYGEIRIYPKENGFDVINIVPLEVYLVSVLPSEMPSFFEIEALKAQAVVARTYSYYFISRSTVNRSYDVDNTTAFQVYNGFSDIVASPNLKNILEAIRSTEGEVVVFDSAPIIAYFHANSGGYLTSGLDYFGEGSNFPYLVNKVDQYSVDMKGYKWEFATTKEEFLEISGIDLNSDNIIVNRTVYGLIDSLVFNEKKYTPKMIRRLYNYKNIKSEKFTYEIKDDNTILFIGYGFGHGVGMSQWGAQNMGMQKFTYKQIIDFYYPQTTIVLY
ncbi:MAG: hypothetical protein A2015_03280 [Spirochaetes bacterium GWF1_31_7]|nr:MAG: hypothetical protein A2Y30_07365 [Spirochaetes bacterium GWE1_32_154]OHD48403.1 MAG: hypothetical protein A2Y29_05240 [Spirochaetes bacterium GWE2_31_10]OHD50880.1 MAG: hypothetical protein A2015_03280 [Spirochaetes bacterium GWF1_31_7]